MRISLRFFTVVILFLNMTLAHAASEQVDGLTIKQIRVVGDYTHGTISDKTIELWFTSSIAWENDLSCTVNWRLYINADEQPHLVSAAYAAFLAGKKVNVYADDALPVRNSSCEIGYLDITNEQT